ncbi:hypothetical protein BDV32DRAFT_146906 [Aspergillus pseudonomiae]|nr:hypothetical protein BDV32DRAFT_146906 [Aspergillus pseudonomiae]
MATKMQEVLLKAAEIALPFVKMPPDTLTKADNCEMDKALASINQLKAKNLPIPTIAVGDLSMQEAAFEGFAVYTDKRKSEMEYVGWTLNAYEKTYERAPWNEPLASTRLDTLLLTTTYILGAYEKPGTAGVNLQQRKKLQGQADYMLFYDRPSKNASNLLIVEAKRHAEFGRGPAGLLSDMAMVVKARHSAGDGERAVVFGLLSDGYTFHFYRLSHGMKYTVHTVHWLMGLTSQCIIKGLLSFIILEALNMAAVSRTKTRHPSELSLSPVGSMELD